MKKVVPLTKLQQTVLEFFFEKPIGQRYFLTGGTALSGFYFHHRKSVDLDLFTFEKLFQDAKKKDLGLSEFYFAHMMLEINNLKDFPKMFVPFNKEKMIKYFINQANKLLLKAKPPF